MQSKSRNRITRFKIASKLNDKLSILTGQMLLNLQSDSELSIRIVS